MHSFFGNVWPLKDQVRNSLDYLNMMYGNGVITRMGALDFSVKASTWSKERSYRYSVTHHNRGYTVRAHGRQVTIPFSAIGD